MSDLCYFCKAPYIEHVPVAARTQEPYNTGMDSKTAMDLHKAELAKRAAEFDSRFVPLSHISAGAANSRQEGGAHYSSTDAVGTCPHCHKDLQHWDWSHNLRGLEYAITKYIARWREKDRLESLKKAIHYTQKLIEIHFPEVTVRVEYSNKSVREVGADQACGGEAMAGSTPTHSENLGPQKWVWCPEQVIMRGNILRCINGIGHGAMHEFN